MRMPTLNELYRPFVVFPVTTQANAELRLERLRGYEAGLDLTPASWAKISLTAFDNRLDGAIANVTTGSNLRQRQNVDAIRARGIEAEAALHFAALRLGGSLAWTDSVVKASGAQAAINGLRPAQTPKFAASGTIAWTPREGWQLAATLRYVGRQFEDDLKTFVLPAATTLDAFVKVPVSGPVSLVLRGENLADETLVTRNQDGSLDLGVPRTRLGGLSRVDLILVIRA